MKIAGLGWSMLVVTAALVGAERHAWAALSLLGSTRCPSPATVRAVLDEMWGPRPGREPDAVATLNEEGDRYGVTVGDHARQWVDPSGACDERARTVAVFIALVTESVAPPPDVDAGQEPPAEPSPVYTAPLRANRTPSARALRVLFEGGLELQLGVGAGLHVINGGIAPHFFIGNAFIGAWFGVALEVPSEFGASAPYLSLVRVPVDLGLRGVLRHGPIELSLDVSAVLSALFLNVGNDGPTRFDAGVGIGLRAAWWIRDKLAPFIAIRAVISPSALASDRRSEGTTEPLPPVWLGISSGIDLDLKGLRRHRP